MVIEETGELVGRDVIVNDDEKKCVLEVYMTALEVDGCELQGEMRVLQKKCLSRTVEVFADVLAAIALCKQSLDLKCRVLEQGQRLAEDDRKLELPSSAEFSAQHSASAKAEKVCKCCEELEDAEE